MLESLTTDNTKPGDKGVDFTSVFLRRREATMRINSISVRDRKSAGAEIVVLNAYVIYF